MGHTESTEITERVITHTDLTDLTDVLYSKELRNKGMDRLLMDDSHRDDCLILAENKGFMLVEEFERTRSFHSSNNIKLIIHK